MCGESMWAHNFSLLVWHVSAYLHKPQMYEDSNKRKSGAAWQYKDNEYELDYASGEWSCTPYDAARSSS